MPRCEDRVCACICAKVADSKWHGYQYANSLAQLPGHRVYAQRVGITVTLTDTYSDFAIPRLSCCCQGSTDVAEALIGMQAQVFVRRTASAEVRLTFVLTGMDNKQFGQLHHDSPVLHGKLSKPRLALEQLKRFKIATQAAVDDVAAHGLRAWADG